MIRPRHALFVLAFGAAPALVAVAACSSASPCERAQYSIIAWKARCADVSASPAEWDAERARVPAACAASSGAPGTTGLADLQAKCAFDLDDAPCGALPADCTSFVGPLPTGSACGMNVQCQSGACVPDKAMGKPGYCGSCQDRLGENGGCKVSSECRPGYLCAVSYDPVSMMDLGVCIKAGGGVGDPCLVESDCRGPNHCARGKCAPPVKKGDACTSRAECDVGLVCSGRCTTTTGLNGACTGFECESGLACDPKTHLCAHVVFAEQGQPCDGVLGLCKRGACTKGVCPTVVGDNQPCDPVNNPTAVCDTFAVCVDGTCQIPDPKKCGSATSG